MATDGKKRRNPFTGSSLGGRILSGSQLPLFRVRPPLDYGILETTGRKSGKQRRCCLRIVRNDNRALLVAIGGQGVGWLANLVQNPDVRVRMRGGWVSATAETIEANDVPEARRTAYCDSVGLFCYPEYMMWRPGRPSPEGIRELHASWLETGTPVLLTLQT